METRFLTFLIIVGFGLLMSCDNNADNTEVEFESTATIIGFDPGNCGCCGGIFININGQEPNKRFTDLPQNSNIDLQNPRFPIFVQLNWSESDSFCGTGITIELIEKIE